jgi:cell division inhibitor SepF
MGLEKIKNSIFGNKEEDNENDDNDLYSGKSSKDALKDISGDGNKMILFEPRAYSESQQIADYLKASNAVIVNLKRVTPDQAKRIVDFLSGTLYAIEGGLQKLGGGIFLCTPVNVPVEGKISDDKDAKETGSSKRPKQEKDNVDLDWE